MMNRITLLASRLCCTVLVATTLVAAGAGAAFADPPGRGGERGDRRDYRDGRDRDFHDRRDRERSGRFEIHEGYRESRRGGHDAPRVIYRDRVHRTPHDRVRWHRDVLIVRPHGHRYSGYAHYHHDEDAWKWLAFTAITLGLLNYLSEAQQREHEAAQVAATTAPIGERIIWSEGGASGSVLATREGTSTSGRYCREFQHEVTVGGRREQAYGTACRGPDGSWEVVSGGNY